MTKRMRYYLDRVTDTKTTTYRYNDMVEGKPVQKDIHAGECIEVYVKPNGDIDGEGDRTGIRREPTFWSNDIAYTLACTHKQALDRPTVTISIPVETLGIKDCSPGAADYCLRAIHPYFHAINQSYATPTRPDRDNGKFILHEPCNKVMVRNTAYFGLVAAKDYVDGKGNVIYVCRYQEAPPDIMCLSIRMEIQLPYMKLTRAKAMLQKQLPSATEAFVRDFDVKGLQEALALEEKQQAIRKFLAESDYCAFIANGSILPREKATDAPAKTAVPFQSPQSHEIEICGVKGMGIKRGVTVVTGGGYSGKSTVLNAISAGIYNHIAGDGRELCITDETAVTITAEDGRAVSSVNISPFIKWIPEGDPACFSTAHGSGSTSQGANIMEAVSLGAQLLLIDEDRSATNFMIQDHVMKNLIEKEPITPFTDRVNELADMGVSTILVIGGSSEYLAIAKDIFMMEDFVMREITTQAKALVPMATPPTPHTHWDNQRQLANMFSAYPTGATRERLEVVDTGFIVIGDERIAIRSLHDLVTEPQANALAFILRHLAKEAQGMDSLEAMALAMRGLQPKGNLTAEQADIVASVARLYQQMATEGLDMVDSGFFTTMHRFMDMPRPFEVLAAINRMRHVAWVQDR